jgi:hypothetical protein
MMDPMIELSIRMFVGGLFALSSINKIRDMNRFSGVVASYFRGLIPPNHFLSRLLAAFVIIWELSIVGAAVSIQSASVVGILASVLLLVYTAGMGINILRGNLLLDCGCSWGGETPVNAWLVARNLVLACCAGLLLLPSAAQTWTVWNTANAAALSLCAYLVYMIVDQLILNQMLKQERPL